MEAQHQRHSHAPGIPPRPLLLPLPGSCCDSRAAPPGDAPTPTCGAPAHDDRGGRGPHARALTARRCAVDKHVLLEGRRRGRLASLHGRERGTAPSPAASLCPGALFTPCYSRAHQRAPRKACVPEQTPCQPPALPGSTQGPRAAEEPAELWLCEPRSRRRRGWCLPRCRIPPASRSLPPCC